MTYIIYVFDEPRRGREEEPMSASPNTKESFQRNVGRAHGVRHSLLSRQNGLLALLQLCVMLASALPLGSGGSALAQESTPITSLKEAPVGPDGQGQPVSLEKQGSFFAGGTVVTSATGDTFHGDAAYVEFQIPHGARKLPMVMWHGGGQFSKTWESTPDGRDGYEQIFTRRGFAVYIIDQPRRGDAGRTTVGTTIPDAVPSESSIWSIFRLGSWVPPAAPAFFPNVQFPKTVQGALDQYYLQETPNTGPENIDQATRELESDAVVDLFNKIGPGILLTHSNSGQYGWTTGILAPNLVRAIIAYEPAAFAFPSDAVPADIPTQNARVAAITAPQLYPPEQFNNLTQMPILIVYGDNIDFNTPSSDFGVELWRVVTRRAAQFVTAVNARGGHAEVLYLPTIGLRGNTHFAFSDLNNVQVADQLSQYLHEHELDRHHH
jgi:pimeloyl-ACP methyl ester carboxylesterase